MKTLTNKWYEEVRQGPSGSEDDEDEAELLWTERMLLVPMKHNEWPLCFLGWGCVSTCVWCCERVSARRQTQFLLWRGFDLKAAGKLSTNFKAIHMHLSALSSSLLCCSLLCGTDCFNRWWRFYFVPGKGCNIMSQKPHYLYLRGGFQTSVIFMPLTKKVHRQINLSNLVLHFSNLKSAVTLLCLCMVHRNTF